MKILKLTAENFKRIEAIEITPDGHVVEITGKNGHGKTSTLDAIWAALDWKTKGKEIPKPIRDGADKAFITLDLGEYTVTRTFNLQEGGEFTTSLRVENKDKFRPAKPQELLNTFLGDLSFDPMEFARLKPREQFDALKQFVPGVDFDEIAQKRKKLYEERTLANRSKDNAAGALASLGEDEEPPVLIDEAALVAKLEEAGRKNAEIQQDAAAYSQRRMLADSHRNMAKEYEEREDALMRQIAQLQDEAQAAAKKASEARVAAAALEKEIQAMPAQQEFIDTAALRADIDAARKHNATSTEYARRAQRRSDLKAEVEKCTAEADALTKAIEALDAEKEKAVKEAKMPVPGLTFGDEQILLNGQPFQQGSDAEQLRATIAIAAAMNPKLRVIRVHEGSHIDSNGMKLVQEFAKANDLQVWVETVESSRPTAVVIEDGRVK